MITEAAAGHLTTVGLVPASAAAPHGPIDLNDAGLPDPEATATSNSGFYGWANVSPGEHTLTVSHPTRTCTNSIDPDRSAGITMEVVADAVVSAWPYRCD